MKFSVVTISYNQAEFLERAIKSVLSQTGVEIEYIVCDPGSTDGSREIIEIYRDRISHVVYEKDKGAADGLNNGFAFATGDIYCYLNSDDTFEPGAFKAVAQYFKEHPDVDVVCGHTYITDRYDNHLRRVWSERYWPPAVAHGAAVQIQPSTFFRRGAYLSSGGFDVTNRRNWDGGLLAAMYASGSKIRVIDQFLSTYRLHASSITNTGRAVDPQTRAANERSFELIMGRKRCWYDNHLKIFYRIIKHLLYPQAMLERVLKGPVFGRKMG